MTYIKFINLYKQNSLAKKKYYFIHRNKITNMLIKKFIELGLIKYTKKGKNDNYKICIYINYIKNTNIYTKIKNLYNIAISKNSSDKDARNAVDSLRNMKM